MTDLAEVLRKIEELPPHKQEIVANVVEALSVTSQNLPNPSLPSSRPFADGPYFGMWADRPEMEDSARWVRELREREWSRNRSGESA